MGAVAVDLGRPDGCALGRSRLTEALERSRQPCALGQVGERTSAANAALVRLLGYEPGEASPAVLAEALTPEEWRPTEDQSLDELRRSGWPQSYQKEVARSDGSRLQVEVLLHAVPSPEGPDLYCAIYRELQADREAILACMTDGLVVADLDGNILEMNPAALKLHGLGSLEEARQNLGRYAERFDLSYPDGRTMPLDEWPISRVIRGETFVHYEVLVRDRYTGLRRVYSYAGSPLHRGPHRPDLGILTIRDITDLIEAQRQATNLARFPAEDPQPVLRLDADGTILYANDASRPLLLAWGREQGDSAPGSWRAQVDVALSTGASRVFEMETGGRFFELEVVPIAEGPYVNVYGRDISRRKAIERQRERYLGRQQALVEVFRRVLAQGSVEDLLQEVTDGARRITGARLGVAGHGYQNGAFRIGTSSRGDGPTSVPHGNDFGMVEGGVYVKLLYESPSLRLTDEELRSHPDWWGLPSGHPPLNGLLGARLVDASGRPSGMILLSDSANGEFTGEDEALLAQLAAMASLGLHHIQARREAEERTRESEAILDSIADGVWVHDTEGRIIRMNSAAQRLSGYGPEEARLTMAERAPRLRMLTADGRPMSHEALPAARALRGETVRSYVFGLEQPNGEYLWVSNSAAPVYGRNGRMLGAVATSTDITGLRRASEQLEIRRTELLALTQDLEVEREQLAVTLRSIGDAVVATDPDGFVVLMNPAAEQLTGWGEDDLKEWTLVDLLDRTFTLHYPGGDPVSTQDRPFPDALKGEAFSGLEVELRTRLSGKATIVNTSFQPVRDQDGRLLLTVIAARDITAEKRVLWERQRLEELKSNFIANTSHELRTPLASVMGYTELLLTGGAGPLSQVQQEFLTTVYESSERLHWLIDDILDVSRMESGRLDLEQSWVDVAGLAGGVLERLRPKASQRGVELEMDLPSDLPPVLGDPRRLEQVFGNLLSNAVKYTPQGGRVSLSAHRLPEWLVVSVCDTGIGIASEDLPHMFERFHRGRHAINENIGGTGLGLYISKSVVEAHHGRIEVESQPGQGSCFRVLLPIPTEDRDGES